MSLLEVQRQFRAFLVDAPSNISLYAGEDGDAGLAVYHHAYRAQLVACLRDTYERVWAWLGDDAFEAAARRHIAERSPHSWTLGDYGGDFPSSLMAIYPDDLEVFELAKLDWALRRAFDGPDAPSVGLADLAEVDWDNAVLTFAPTLSVFAITTNCGAIWSAIAAEENPPRAALLPGPAAIRVWRAGLSPHFCSIEAMEMRALAWVSEGATFPELCAHLETETDTERALQLAGQMLASWVQDGLLQSVS